VLRFRLGPFPVAIEPWFWISAVLLGPGLGRDWSRLLIWVLVVFLSVLIHEIGHAVVAKGLGGRPQIILRAFGGVTLPLLQKRPSWLAEVVLSVAGPLFGLSLYGVAWLMQRYLMLETGSPLWTFARLLEFTSLAWTLLNLLPILPLDGGHVLQAVLTGVRKKDSLRAASIVSAVVAVAFAVYEFTAGGNTFLAIFFLLFAGQNFAAFRATRPGPRAAAEEPAGPNAAEQAEVARLTEVARGSLRNGDVQGALAAAELLESGEGTWRQAAGHRVRAGILLSQGALDDAGRFAGRSYALLPHADAAVIAARANLRSGDREAARSWLRRAVEAGAAPDTIRADAELGTLIEPPAVTAP
jgi:hypothetical protein